MNVYKYQTLANISRQNAPLDYRIESRFVKIPGETRNFKWSLMFSFNTLDEALVMIRSLRKDEGDNPVEEYRLTGVDVSFTNN